MKKQRQGFLIIVLAAAFLMLLAGCKAAGSEQITPSPFDQEEGEQDPFIGVPNPASFYCQEMGYQLDLRETDQGTQGVCIFPDGNECDQWEFLAGSCAIEWSFCQRQGYNIQAGDNIATCTFPDGSSCPEYAFFISECESPH